MEGAFVYMMTNRPRGVLYIGMSNADLPRRIWQHKHARGSAFTHRYNLKTLVWYEPHAHVTAAAERERRIKRWRRAWKIELVEAMNPAWTDLYETLF